MKAFRVFLLFIWIALAIYTVTVAINHGMDLFSIFFGDIGRMGWPGQFNLDFTSMLALAGLWIAWRHQFSGPGIILGLLALFGGAWFLSTYLLVITARSGDNVPALLLGPNWATK